MTRRSFFTKLCAVATAPFAAKAVKPIAVWGNTSRIIKITIADIPAWVCRRNWGIMRHCESRPLEDWERKATDKFFWEQFDK